MSTRDDARWVICAAAPGGAVRFEAPVEVAGVGGPVWVEVRALSHREALERESLGVVESYELTGGDQAVEVLRQYDLWAMAAYDYTHSLVDFCLPEREPGGEVRLRRGSEGTRETNLELLSRMPPALAEWVRGCIDRVNMRHAQGQEALEQAKKKSGS